MSRGDLLIIAERAVERLPREELDEVLADRIRCEDLVLEESAPESLVNEVRAFHAASVRGEYYDDLDINLINSGLRSKGTDAFIAEFDRLIKKCTRASSDEAAACVRDAFDSLFDVLRRINDCPDDIVYFAEEGGAWQVCRDWRSILPAYFRCLAKCVGAEEFAAVVNRVITDFAEYDRPSHLAAAHRAASPDQRAALERLLPPHR
jgi:hypothetical protein